MSVYHYEYESPVGPLYLLATDRGLCYVGFSATGERGEKFLKKYFPGEMTAPGGIHNQEAVRQLSNYFDGHLKEFTVHLDLKADGFNRKVLEKVKAIAFGKVRTYGEIAAELGKPGAARAVGNANRLNPIPIIIPCHRVVATNGLGGYGGGLPVKKQLLELEGVLAGSML